MMNKNKIKKIATVIAIVLVVAMVLTMVLPFFKGNF